MGDPDQLLRSRSKQDGSGPGIMGANRFYNSGDLWYNVCCPFKSGGSGNEKYERYKLFREDADNFNRDRDLGKYYKFIIL